MPISLAGVEELTDMKAAAFACDFPVLKPATFACTSNIAPCEMS